MSFLVLPSDCITCLLSEWIDMIEFALLDSAMTNHKLRDKYCHEIARREFSLSGSVIFPYSSNHRQTYVNWLGNRALKMKYFMIYSSIIIENRFSPDYNYCLIDLGLCSFKDELSVEIADILKKCINLQCIRLSKIDMDKEKLKEIFGLLPNPNKLVKVIIFHVHNVTVSILSYIASISPNVKILKINGAINQNKEIKLNEFLQYTTKFTTLIELELSDCRVVNDKMLGWLVSDCVELKTINICDNICDTRVNNLSVIPSKNLTMLSVRRFAVTDNIGEFIKQCPNLEHVDFCTDQLDIIQSLPQFCCKLNHFHFLQASNALTNTIMKELIKALPNITSIVLDGCNQISDSFLEYLITYCNNLKILQARSSVFSDSMVCRLVQRFTDLRELSIQYNPLSSNTVSALCKCEMLEKLSICVGSVNNHDVLRLVTSCSFLTRLIVGSNNRETVEALSSQITASVKKLRPRLNMHIL